MSNLYQISRRNLLEENSAQFDGQAEDNDNNGVEAGGQQQGGDSTTTSTATTPIPTPTTLKQQTSLADASMDSEVSGLTLDNALKPKGVAIVGLARAPPSPAPPPPPTLPLALPPQPPQDDTSASAEMIIAADKTDVGSSDGAITTKQSNHNHHDEENDDDDLDLAIHLDRSNNTETSFAESLPSQGLDSMQYSVTASVQEEIARNNAMNHLQEQQKEEHSVAVSSASSSSTEDDNRDSSIAAATATTTAAVVGIGAGVGATSIFRSPGSVSSASSVGTASTTTSGRKIYGARSTSSSISSATTSRSFNSKTATTALAVGGAAAGTAVALSSVKETPSSTEFGLTSDGEDAPPAPPSTTIDEKPTDIMDESSEGTIDEDYFYAIAASTGKAEQEKAIGDDEATGQEEEDGDSSSRNLARSGIAGASGTGEDDFDYKRYRWYLGIAIGIAIVILIVVIAVLVSRRNRSDDDPATPSPTPPPPTLQPSLSPTSTVVPTVQPSLPPVNVPELITRISTWDGGEAASTPGTPQFRAMEWLEQDPHERTEDDVIQRYSLATLYYATGGPEFWSITTSDTASEETSPTTTTSAPASTPTSATSPSSPTTTTTTSPSSTTTTTMPSSATTTAPSSNSTNSTVIFPRLGRRQAQEETVFLSYDVDVCDWYTTAVFEQDDDVFNSTCNDDGMLHILALENSSLIGTLPPELGLLTSLVLLDLDSNGLYGPLPPELFIGLTNLRFLDLFNNIDDVGFSGINETIPTEIGLATELRYIDVDSNQLGGEIPTEMGNLENLAILWLARNNLEGTIPREFGKLVSLQELYVYGNINLTGNMPREVCMLFEDYEIIDDDDKLGGNTTDDDALIDGNSTDDDLIDDDLIDDGNNTIDDDLIDDGNSTDDVAGDDDSNMTDDEDLIVVPAEDDDLAIDDDDAIGDDLLLLLRYLEDVGLRNDTNATDDDQADDDDVLGNGTSTNTTDDVVVDDDDIIGNGTDDDFLANTTDDDLLEDDDALIGGGGGMLRVLEIGCPPDGVNDTSSRNTSIEECDCCTDQCKPITDAPTLLPTPSPTTPVTPGPTVVVPATPAPTTPQPILVTAAPTQEEELTSVPTAESTPLPTPTSVPTPQPSPAPGTVAPTEEDLTPSVQTTSVPSSTPSSNSTSAEPVDIPTLLNSVSSDGGQARQTEGTPQFTASEWIVNNNSAANYSQVRILQRYALATVYHATNGPAWANSASWVSDANECDWALVNCENGTSGDAVVTTFVPIENGLAGPLPPEVGILTNLVQLTLRANSLNQVIPTEIGLLARLQIAEFDGNGFVSTLPSQMGQLSQLRLARFNGNNVEGRIPETFVNLRGAQELFFQDTSLTGSVPQGMCNLTNITTIQVDCGEVNCTCCSPDCSVVPRPLEEYLNALASVSTDGGEALRTDGSSQRLALEWIAQDDISHGASLEATDATVYSRFALATFYHSMNGTGWISSSGWLSNQPLCNWEFVTAECNTGSLVVVNGLTIMNNQVGGSLPPELLLLSNLKFLDFTGVQISAPLPDWFAFPSMDFLGLVSCGLTGGLPQSLTQMQNLTGLTFYSNQLDGNIPVDILATLTKLSFLDIGNNRYTGAVPEGLTALSAMKFLFLEENENLSGNIHESYATAWSNLETLAFSQCDFTGLFPASIWAIATLRLLELDNNTRLDVEFPPTRSSVLEVISLGRTRFARDTIPIEIGTQQPSLKVLDLSSTQVGGLVPSELGLLSNLTDVYLQETNIGGALPSELGLASNLVELNLYSTNLEGTVPTEVGALPQLLRIYFENTNLVAPLPVDLCKNQNEEFFDFWSDCQETGCTCCTFCCVDNSECVEQ